MNICRKFLLLCSVSALMLAAQTSWGQIARVPAVPLLAPLPPPAKSTPPTTPPAQEDSGQMFGMAVAEQPPGSLRVATVTPGSTASKAGLKRGDVIVSVGEKTVASYRDLLEGIAAVKPARQIPLVVERDEQQYKTELVVGRQVARFPEPPTSEPSAGAQPEPPEAASKLPTTIEGVVVIDGIPQPNMVVHVWDDDGVADRVVTDARGRFAFAAPPGQYLLSAKPWAPERAVAPPPGPEAPATFAPQPDPELQAAREPIPRPPVPKPLPLALAPVPVGGPVIVPGSPFSLDGPVPVRPKEPAIPGVPNPLPIRPVLPRPAAEAVDVEPDADAVPVTVPLDTDEPVFVRIELP